MPPHNYNQLAQARRMTITNPSSKHAYTTTTPLARNWVSTNNQDRARMINEFKDKETTKYAVMLFTSVDGEDITINGVGGPPYTYNVTNIFKDGTGLTPTYIETYKPPYMKDPKFIIEGSTNTLKEWITWKSHNQLVEIEGNVVCGVTSNTVQALTLRLYINDLPIPSNVSDTLTNLQVYNTAVNSYIDAVNNDFTTTTLPISTRVYLLPNDTIKLMIGHTESSNNTQQVKVFTTNLRVRTIPM